jgi:hypothetical protein
MAARFGRASDARAMSSGDRRAECGPLGLARSVSLSASIVCISIRRIETFVAKRFGGVQRGITTLGVLAEQRRLRWTQMAILISGQVAFSIGLLPWDEFPLCLLQRPSAASRSVVTGRSGHKTERENLFGGSGMELRRSFRL